MLGAIIVAIVIVVIIPVSLFIGGALAASVIGTVAKRDAEQRHEGSELIDLNT